MIRKVTMREIVALSGLCLLIAGAMATPVSAVEVTEYSWGTEYFFKPGPDTGYHYRTIDIDPEGPFALDFSFYDDMTNHFLNVGFYVAGSAMELGIMGSQGGATDPTKYYVSAPTYVPVATRSLGWHDVSIRMDQSGNQFMLDDTPVFSSPAMFTPSGIWVRSAIGGGDSWRVGGPYDNNAENIVRIYDTPPPQQKILSGVPEYEWRRGCSPTSAAMLMGYWDQNGYPNLWAGTPPTMNNPANDADPVNIVIEEIGDLMGTSTSPPGSNDYGNTDPGNIDNGMRDFAKAQDSSYKFKAGNKYASDRWKHGGSWFEGFSFEYLKREIDADRPMHVGIKANQLDPQPTDRWGHSIAVYGYQDNPGTDNDWVAVHDTWPDGNSDGDDGIIAKVENGVEYWKWVTDTSQDYYIYRGGWLHPEQVENSIWGLLESRFSSERRIRRAVLRDGWNDRKRYVGGFGG